MGHAIKLNFGNYTLDAELYDTPIAEAFFRHLPLEIDLTQWGNELYGGIGADLGEQAPTASIAEGGLAYTNRGHLLCIFFGQAPAWPVESIGQIKDDQWQKLLENHPKDRVVVQSA